MHMSKDNPIDIIVKDVFSEKLGIDFQFIQSETSLKDDLCIDSLDYVEIIMEIEKKFKVRITDEESEQFRTVNHIVQFIKLKI
jgi:acyl carrier protein